MSENEDFPTLTPFEHTFDYGKTVEQLREEQNQRILNSGRSVECADSVVGSSSVVRRKGDLVQFSEHMSDAAVDAWCVANGKRRGTPHETFTVATADESLHRKHALVSGRGDLTQGNFYAVIRTYELDVRFVNPDWHRDVYSWSASAAFVIFDIEPQPA